MMTHPNPEIQTIFDMLERQRDEAILYGAQQRAQVVEAQMKVIEKDKEIAVLTEQLLAAAKFQAGGDAKKEPGEVVVHLPLGGGAA